MRFALRKRSSGFTIVELAVVIVILGILLTLVSLTYNGVRAKSRNNQRQSDINALQTQLETYYAQSASGEYPTLAQLNDSAWRMKNMPKLTAGNVSDPRWSAKDGCTIASEPAFNATPKINCYAYQVTDTSGGPCNDTTDPCAHYTLTATLEGGQLTYVKSSLN